MKTRSEYLLELIYERKYKKGCEIGLWYGKTFFLLLEKIPDLTLFGVDIWTTCEASHSTDQVVNRRTVYEKASRFPGARIMEISSKRAAQAFSPESLDFVFIDADHTEQGVQEDIAAWWGKVRRGGIVCGDDYDFPSVRKTVDALIGDVHIEGGFFWWKEVA